MCVSLELELKPIICSVCIIRLYSSIVGHGPAGLWAVEILLSTSLCLLYKVHMGACMSQSMADCR